MRRRTTILFLLAAVALLGAACGDDDDGDDGQAAVAGQPDDDAEQDTPGSGTSSPTGGMYDDVPSGSTSGGASTAATVQVSEHPDLGKILVGPDGRTLYLFANDQGTTSACTGGCAGAWPALTATAAPTAGDGVDKSKLSTVTGQAAGHVAYNGHLLYYFVQDTQPGDAKGVMVPNWFAVDPAGNQIAP